MLTKKPRSLNEKQLSREQQSALANAKAGIEQRVADAKAELIRRRREHDDSTMAAKGPRRALPRGRSLRIRPAAQAPTLSVADAEAIRAGCGGGQAWLRPAMDNMTLSTSSAATRRRGAKLSSAMRTFAPIPPAQLAVSSRSRALRRSKSRHHHHPPGGNSRDVDARDHLDRWDRRPALRLPVRAMEHRIRKATWRQSEKPP